MTEDIYVNKVTPKSVQVRQRQGGKIYLKPKNPASLVMLSSGLDSIYALVKLLTETDDTVLVHHVHMINNEDRHEIEADRTRKVVEWCRREYRDFRYSESAINHKGFKGYGYDIMSVAFEAGMMCRSFIQANDFPVSKLLTGWCLEEESHPGRAAHVMAVVTANCFPYQPPKFFFFDRVSKADEARYLPLQLVEMSWTCRSPVKSDTGEFIECGKCPSCEVMAPIHAMRNEQLLVD